MKAMDYLFKITAIVLLFASCQKTEICTTCLIRCSTKTAKLDKICRETEAEIFAEIDSVKAQFPGPDFKVLCTIE